MRLLRDKRLVRKGPPTFSNHRVPYLLRQKGCLRRIGVSTLCATLAISSASFGQDVGDPFFGLPIRISVGTHLGYGMVNMQELNSAIREAGTIRQAADSQGEATELLNGGFYWEGWMTFRLSRVLFGLGVSSLETTGKSIYDQGFFLSDELSGRATELFATAGIRIPSDGPLFLDLLAGCGITMATMDYRGEYRDFFDPSQHFVFTQSLAKDFFSGRVLVSGGLRVAPARILLTVGYRFADAGVMEGPTEFNGQASREETPFVDFRGREVSFDFSGAFLGGGLSIEF